MTINALPLLALTGGEFRDFLCQTLPFLMLAGYLLGFALIISGISHAYREEGPRAVVFAAIMVAVPPVFYALCKFLRLIAVVILLQVWGAHLAAGSEGTLTFNQPVGAGCMTRFHAVQKVVRPLAPLVADTQRRDVAFKCLARFITN